MKGSSERIVSSKHSSIDSPRTVATSTSSEAGPSSHSIHKTSVWSGFLVSAFAIFNSYSEPRGNKVSSTKNLGWTTALKRVVNSGSMRRILGLNKAGISSSRSDIWLLGTCYKVTDNDSITDPSQSEGFASFVEDFSSRILITYRKGFAPIGDSKYTSDASWGCMLRSSQMLVAQALLCHQLGRSWRKTVDQPMDQKYIKLLHMFGDSELSAYSIHNLLEAGKNYGLSPGSWVGPYAMCRTWETLYRSKKHDTPDEDLSSVIAIYVVSGDEDGERGGAPVICIDDITTHCVECSKGQVNWLPIILLVPLVLGLDKLNTRYLPLLGATFCFPQSLGILGGSPGASTYIIGLQDDNAFYLDPHEVQQVVDITRDNLEADTASYHSNILRHIRLDSLDPSLAIGFYCRDKSDFDDFCVRASELANRSNGAPLFTVTQSRKSSYPSRHNDNINNNAEFPLPGSYDMVPEGEPEGCAHEDDWQLL
ncbi:cysteine protease ATG4-like [Coffea eugenioides]|uniref:cysteine protease ATG4-like n=1 Tax=Coffea eugenioides TaxID=49369 RepID=UPI000F60F4EA|nr:cysteine protease ATG4-like [Coffea eugenioides]XP_027163004.1 cysteine protease ATG4-like [Coffea eugenioides]XP_027163005.1 cysteine protease ATG4-like [Coffea eugenioides]